MVKSKEDLKKALAETFNEMTRFTEVTSESTPEDLSDTLARMICNKTSRQDVNETSSQDATSIKGKVVDDSEIGDGKALTYSRVKDKIVYKRLGGGRGGGVVVEGGWLPQSFVEVMPNSGADLVQTIAAYGDEREIRVPAGIFAIDDDDLTIGPLHLKGIGKPTHMTTPADGTTIRFTNGKRLIGATNTKIVLEDLAIQVTGDYSANADSPIDFFDNSIINAHRCAFYLGMTLANGNAATPTNALGGVAMMIGKSSGPSGTPSMFRDCRFIDQRQGTPSNTYLFGAIVENLIMEGNFGYEVFANGLVTPRRFYINPITCATFIGNSAFKDAARACVYDVEYICTGNNKNLHFINNQFVPAARILTAHFKTSGTLFVSGENPFDIEGGVTPVALSQSGTVTQKWKGRGYENSGSSAIVSGQTHVHVPHGLVSTPSKIRITPTAKSTADPTFYIWVNTIGAAEFIVNCQVDPGVATLPFLWEADV